MSSQVSEARVISDRYELTGRRLGSGGMGVIFEAKDRLLARSVAVKLLSPALSAQPQVRERFSNEARHAAGLTHPNVVTVYDVGEHDGAPYIVMECLPGLTVADEISRGPMEPSTVHFIATEVLRALDHAHAAGVIHRDIKPGNILLTSNGIAKVGDFGIAKSLGSDVTRTQELMGSPAYISPEQLAGVPAGPASDIYALGVTMYEMLTGTKPFIADTPWSTLSAIQRGEYEPLAKVAPGVDPRLVSVVERAMAASVTYRYQSARQMLKALAATLRSRPISDSPVTVDSPRTGRLNQQQVPAADRTQVLTDDQATVALDRPAVELEELWPFTRRRQAKRKSALSRMGLSSKAAMMAASSAVIALALVMGAIALSNDPATPDPTPSAVAEVDDTPLQRSLDRLERAVRP